MMVRQSAERSAHVVTNGDGTDTITYFSNINIGAAVGYTRASPTIRYASTSTRRALWRGATASYSPGEFMLMTRFILVKVLTRAVS
jgi:hypothetical protein